MVKNTTDALYIGVAADPNKRLATHNKGQGASFTKIRENFAIVFMEKYDSLAAARQREIQLKKWSRKKKDFLIKRYQQGLKTKLTNN